MVYCTYNSQCFGALLDDLGKNRPSPSHALVTSDTATRQDSVLQSGEISRHP